MAMTKKTNKAPAVLTTKRKRTFNDGIVDLYAVRDDDLIEPVETGLRFGVLTVGSQRFFAAKDQQHDIDKLICIPLLPKELHANTVAIISGEQYDVLQAQEIRDTLPPTWQLSLERIKEANSHDVYTDA